MAIYYEFARKKVVRVSSQVDEPQTLRPYVSNVSNALQHGSAWLPWQDYQLAGSSIYCQPAESLASQSGDRCDQ